MGGDVLELLLRAKVDVHLQHFKGRGLRVPKVQDFVQQLVHKREVVANGAFLKILAKVTLDTTTGHTAHCAAKPPTRTHLEDFDHGHEELEAQGGIRVRSGYSHEEHVPVTNVQEVGLVDLLDRGVAAGLLRCDHLHAEGVGCVDRDIVTVHP